MKVRVYSTSGPSWQPVKNGQPYNKWVGTIQFSDVERVMFGRRYTATVCGASKQDVTNKLDRYLIGEVVDVNPDKLNGFYQGS